MGPRRLVLLGLVTAGLAAACSSGLEGLDAGDTTGRAEPAKSTNLRFGFDPGIELSAPITDIEVCGGVIGTLTGSRERPVAFVAFATQTGIDDPDDGTTDANAVGDVFVAAVDAESVDPRAFTYSIAGTMLHPRCVTCHQMNVDAQDPAALDPTPFLTQPHFDGGGTPPLNEFNDSTCKDCHFEDWLAPGPSFDLRREGTRELFARALTPPSGLEEHFRTDPRVLWALDRGDTPFGGAADDDHDGIDEPEDHDGVRRHAPGGKESFLERFDGWLATADPVTGELAYSSAADALQDVVLASRNMGGSQSANGASSAPSLVYEPNPGFDPGAPTLAPAGFLHVAFQSDASNMAGGMLNGASDVFRVTIDVRVTAQGEIDLIYQPASQVLISVAFGGGDAKGASRDPDIGANGERIAFVSEANNLIDGFPLVCRPEVYLHDDLAGISLVSHVPGDPDQPGDAGATNPDLSLDGQAVCFESDATDLVAGDTNSARDVFFALWPSLDVERASVMDGGGELTSHSHRGSIHHSGGAVRVAFASQESALPPVVAVQCPDEVEVLLAARDTHIRSFDPDTNYDTIPDNLDPLASLKELYVGFPNVGFPATPEERRTLVAFDLSAIPMGATINAVTLSLNMDRVPPSAADNTIAVHRITADWVDQTVTWNSLGNSFVPTASASVLIDGADPTGPVEWSSLAMRDDVQLWLDSGDSFGWLLDGTSTAAFSVRRFDSVDDQTAPSLLVDFTPPVAPLPATLADGSSCVYLRDTALGRTLNLNQAVSPEGTLPAQELDVDGTPLAASATNPVISPSGNAVLFESMAQNLDVVRPFDENRLMDVVLVDLLQLEAQGFVLPYKVSVTADGGNANGPSHSPRFGAFTPPTDAFPLGLAIYATEATNLGDTDPGDLNDDGVPEADNFLLSFLCEGGSVLADFVAEPARQGMGRDVTFESTSSGEPTDFLWDFGDGTPTSTKASPSHAYELPGLYTVTLSVSGERGTDDRTRIEYVHVLDAVMASFRTTKDASLSQAPTQDPATGEPHTATIVGAIDDTDPGARLLFDLDSEESTEFPDEFAWKLRPVDAAGSPLGNAVLVSDQPNPRDVPIAATGLYDLRLEATGPGGVGTATQRIEVYQKVDASFDSSPGGSPVRGPANLTVQFTDTSSGDALDTNGHFWTFGDGSFSNEASPTHTFDPGVYFVNLTVFGKGTDSDLSASLPVIADGTITAAFTTAPQSAGSISGLLSGEAIDEGSGVLVDFVNASQHQSASPLFFRWTFGTGAPTGQEMVQDPSGILYSLSNPENVQSFQIGLVTSTINPAPLSCGGQLAGTCDERTGTLTVYPRPMVDFAPPGPSFASPGNRPPHTVILNGTVVGDGVGTDPEYRWLRSEANQTGASLLLASGLDAEVEFPGPGVYEVVLEVQTNGPGDTRLVAQSAAQGVVVSASTLTEWYTQAVAVDSGARCTKCHTGATAPAGLVWSLEPGEGIDVIFQRIVEDAQGMPVLSKNCDTSRRLIQPGNPEESVVYNVLLKPSGPLCPINMRPNLPGSEEERDAHVAVLKSWILDGAPNN